MATLKLIVLRILTVLAIFCAIVAAKAITGLLLGQ